MVNITIWHRVFNVVNFNVAFCGIFNVEFSTWNFPHGTFHMELSTWNFPHGTFHVATLKVENSTKR
jgi:hypothetical protein